MNSLQTRANKLLQILKVIPKLGYWNVAYTIWYKLSIKFGIRKQWFKTKPPIYGQFYHETFPTKDYLEEWKTGLSTQVENIYSGKFTWFSYHKFNIGTIPNWFYNPFDKIGLEDTKQHWTELSDFNLSTGDIKIIWELSRFDWLTILARGYKVFGEEKYLDRINELLIDWSTHNPLNIGPNWKCGQETSIRMMKLLSSADILDQLNQPERSLQEMVFQHLERIVPNINYAIAQDNNHGTSEAAAMYIGTVWLIETGYKASQLEEWKRRGRRILENRILRLVQPHGTFSQRSMTYHRVMVDTMTFVLHTMNLLEEPTFSHEILERLRQLSTWQYKLTFGKEGDAPNFGSNDGAMFENLHSIDYRDFRVSTQTFYGVLFQKRAYDNLKISESLYWRQGVSALDYSIEKIVLPQTEILDNQMVLMRNERTIILLKNPEDSFRPGNDVFHIDIWHDGESIMTDRGTYSYNAGILTDKFKSVSSHNTIQFDNHEQMPKISRFLNGGWIRNNKNNGFIKKDNTLSWQGSYKDYKGNKHSRTVSLSEKECIILDEIKTQEKAIVRYHFSNTDAENYRIENINEYKESKTETSLYYLQKESSKRLEKTVNKSTKFRISFK